MSLFFFSFSPFTLKFQQFIAPRTNRYIRSISSLRKFQSNSRWKAAIRIWEIWSIHESTTTREKNHPSFSLFIRTNYFLPTLDTFTSSQFNIPLSYFTVLLRSFFFFIRKTTRRSIHLSIRGSISRIYVNFFVHRFLYYQLIQCIDFIYTFLLNFVTVFLCTPVKNQYPHLFNFYYRVYYLTSSLRFEYAEPKRKPTKENILFSFPLRSKPNLLIRTKFISSSCRSLARVSRKDERPVIRTASWL